MGLLWLTDPVPDEATAYQRAAAGMAYLDHRFGPCWDMKLDLKRLDIASPLSCVLAQLRIVWISPSRAFQCGFSTGILNDFLVVAFQPAPLVRSFTRLTRAWKVLLQQRRHEREVQRLFREERVAASRDVTVARIPVQPNNDAGTVVGSPIV